MKAQTKSQNEELQDQYRFLCLKRMLLKYDIKSFNISDTSLAKGLVRQILKRVEINEAMEDALQVFLFYFIYFIN